MNVTAFDLRQELDGFGRVRTARVSHLLGKLHRQGGRARHLSLSLALAVASRESGIRNVTGDGGHGRGLWQSDDRWETAALRSVRGCRAGGYVPVYRSALPAGRVPCLRDAFVLFTKAFDEHFGYGVAYGIPPEHRIAFALSSYNCGPGNALKGYKQGDVDKYTANGNYSSDTLERQKYLHTELMRRGY